MLNRLLVILILWLQTFVSAKTPLNVAVLELDNAGLKLNEIDLLTNRLQSEFVKTGSYNIIERSKIQKL